MVLSSKLVTKPVITQKIKTNFKYKILSCRNMRICSVALYNFLQLSVNCKQITTMVNVKGSVFWIWNRGI
jgi:hypothetical protein